MDKYSENNVFSNPIIWKTPVQIQQLVLCNHPKHLWMSFWDIKSIIQICQSCQQNLQKMFKNPFDMWCGICLALFSLFLHNKSLVTAESVQVRSNTLFLVPLLTRNRGLFSASFSAFFTLFNSSRRNLPPTSLERIRRDKVIFGTKWNRYPEKHSYVLLFCVWLDWGFLFHGRYFEITVDMFIPKAFRTY